MNKGSNNLNIHSKESELIKVPRLYAQADISIPDQFKIPIVRKNGEVVYKTAININDEKITDTCFQIFQNSSLAKDFEYKKLRTEAENALEEKFIEHNLVISHTNEISKNDDIDKKREIAIAQWIRNYIENNLSLSFNVDFDQFIEMTGVKSAKRIGNALTMLNEIQSKMAYKYKVEVLSDNFWEDKNENKNENKENNKVETIEPIEIRHRFTTVFAIPKIEIDLDDEVGKDIKTIQEYIDLNIKNKKKHIKGLIITVSPSYLSAVLGLGRDYTSIFRKQRDKFTTTYAFRLDTLLRSIQKVQHTKYNRFTIEEFQRKMGTNYEQYKDLNRSVIKPALENINTYTTLDVQLIEHKKSRKVEAISFSIRNKNIISEEKEYTKFGINTTAYYIASRMYYFENNQIENLLAYAKWIEKNSNTSLDLALYGDKTYEEWEIEAKIAIGIEKEILIFIDDNRRMFSTLNLFYDEKRMCLVEKRIVSRNPKEHDYTPIETTKLINTPSYRVTNPITSLKYIEEVVKKVSVRENSIRDFMPFYINPVSGSVYINSIKTYLKYEDLITYELYKLNRNYFTFEEGTPIEREELFTEILMRGHFIEVTMQFRKTMSKIEDKINGNL